MGNGSVMFSFIRSQAPILIFMDPPAGIHSLGDKYRYSKCSMTQSRFYPYPSHLDRFYSVIIVVPPEGVLGGHLLVISSCWPLEQQEIINHSSSILYFLDVISWVMCNSNRVAGLSCVTELNSVGVLWAIYNIFSSHLLLIHYHYYFISLSCSRFTYHDSPDLINQSGGIMSIISSYTHHGY